MDKYCSKDAVIQLCWGIPSFAISPQIVLTQSQYRPAVWNWSICVPNRADQFYKFTSWLLLCFYIKVKIKRALGNRFHTIVLVSALKFGTVVWAAALSEVLDACIFTASKPGQTPWSEQMWTEASLWRKLPDLPLPSSVTSLTGYHIQKRQLQTCGAYMFCPSQTWVFRPQ